ncbi:hypothetical protein FGG65_gp48 [Corynebacterium phage phi673]|uniref:Uncharacterized protein n=1 Tax=Corynebacterium phage phi673 TaxID=2052821 RepID=A0A2H4PIV0_9CAUD|nr:hypothetical protein FGG65_gp48 [Corynebacterium phage phi673]ATW62910.1 hypothetical protein phi673_gp48 [Corynebacterium phage phi673]
MSIEQRLITNKLQSCESWAPGYMEGACIMRQKYAPKYGTHGAPSNVKMDAYYIAKTVDGKKYRIAGPGFIEHVEVGSLTSARRMCDLMAIEQSMYLMEATN